MQHRFMTIATLALLITACSASASSLGTFRVNDKAVILTSVVLVERDKSKPELGYMLVISEKTPPPAIDARTALIADAKIFGAAIVLAVNKLPNAEWSNATGCGIRNAPTKKPFGADLGANDCELSDVSMKNGEFHAHLVAVPDAKHGDDTIAIDVKLNVKMP